MQDVLRIAVSVVCTLCRSEEAEELAVEWFSKAAEQGLALAQLNLGSCYFDGTGVAKDEERAVEWYSKAAEQENLDNNFKLCIYHTLNEVRTVEFWTFVARQGQKRAQKVLDDHDIVWRE